MFILAILLILSGIVLFPYFTVSNKTTITMSASCEGGCSDVTMRINSNSSIHDITVGLMQVPSDCLQSRGLCDPWATCGLPTGFFFNINTMSNTDEVQFKGVGQGYYWLYFGTEEGKTGTSQMSSMKVINQTAYIATFLRFQRPIFLSGLNCKKVSRDSRPVSLS